MKAIKGEVLLVSREMTSEPALGALPLKVGGLVLEVQQRPEFEARIRDRQVDAIVARLLAGVRKVRMGVDIEDAPDFVVGQERIAPAPRLPLRLLLALGGEFDQGLGYAGAVVDLHHDEPVAERRTEGTEVTPFRAAPFAENENAPPRLAPGLAAAQVAIPPIHPSPGEPAR